MNATDATARPTTRRTLLLGSTAAGLSSGLTACGQAGTGGTGGTAGSPLPATGEPVTIDFYHRWQAEREPVMVEQVNDFHKLQSRVQINNNLMWPWSQEKILTMVVAGTPPDVTMIDLTGTADFASKGALHGVETLLKRDRISPKDTFYPASVQLMQYEGKNVAMPQTVAGVNHILWINVEMWQRAGLDVAKLPKTWDDLLAAALTLTKRSDGGFEQIAGIYPVQSRCGPPPTTWAGSARTARRCCSIRRRPRPHSSTG